MTESSDDTRTHVPLTTGTMVSHYRIIEKIGAGGMGEVYLAEDTKLDRKVALKFLPLQLCHDPECRARFTREAQAAAKLDHPNIVSVFEVGEYQGRPFFSMQHVEGLSLKEVLAGKAMPLDRVIEIGIQVCDGLQAAHERGITHRDIKPSNILIDSHGRARIVDFGLASILGTEQLTKTGSTLGTIGYMSPEQVRGDHVDQRTDIFSFGVVLYEMITGHPPFKADSEAATLHAITNTKPELLARFRREVPPELQTVIDKALEKNVSTRYQHTDDLAADLRRLSSTATSRPKARRDWWNRYVVTSSAVVLLIVAGYWVVNEYVLNKGTRPESGRKMVAVLPFENLGSPEDEYFADGITEEITTNLASLSGLGVISRTSSMQYKKTDKGLKQIGKELGVDYVLEGTIRWEKAGAQNRVRITPQLIRVSDDSHVWADRYDAVLTDVFQVQSTIANEVAAALDVTLLQSERDVLAQRPNVDPQAYDYYLRGKQYFSVARYKQAEIPLAENMFLKAIERAPDFALAYAELGSLYTETYWDGTIRTQSRLDSARIMVEKAMQLAPNSAEAHEAVGWYYYHGLRDYERALDEFSKVLRIQPNNALALASIAWVERRQGKWQEAIAGLEQVNRLDPRDAWYRYELGMTYYCVHRYSEAIAQFDQVIDLQPTHQWVYLIKAMAVFVQTGDPAAARKVLDAGRSVLGRWPELTWMEVYFDVSERKYDSALCLLTAPASVVYPGTSGTPDASDYYSVKGFTYQMMGRPQSAKLYFDSARVQLEKRLSQTPNSAPLLSSMAYVLVGLGQFDRAIAMAKRSVDLLPITTDALDGPDLVRTLAMVYALAGQQDKAIETLDYLLSIPSPMSAKALAVMPEFTSLRNNPKFQQLLIKYGQNHGA
ncbi:hypothetical protein C3F09_04085 [candidate division GN15 bacterium]|uniref:non-specific serine/threonine protein kinase n=1 Tax=candidate division GN15 bacterium TaxID=2072418 RepID=A0A855X9D4_9BACT|nr:MAG: hypothetical protein C3F09_04085 [candidate division GN15 bacterium]